MNALFKEKKNGMKSIIVGGAIVLVTLVAAIIYRALDSRVIYFESEPNIKDVVLSNSLQPLNKKPDIELEMKEKFIDFKNQDLDDQSLVYFLNNNFSFNNNFNLVAVSPEEFYKAKGGNSFDLAVFLTDVLDNHVVSSGIIRFDYKNEDVGSQAQAVAIYRDRELPKYITLSSEGSLEIYHHGWSFTELIAAEESRLGREIYRYAYFPKGFLDLSEPASSYEWQFIR